MFWNRWGKEKVCPSVLSIINHAINYEYLKTLNLSISIPISNRIYCLHFMWKINKLFDFWNIFNRTSLDKTPINSSLTFINQFSNSGIPNDWQSIDFICTKDNIDLVFIVWMKHCTEIKYMSSDRREKEKIFLDLYTHLKVVTIEIESKNIIWGNWNAQHRSKSDSGTTTVCGKLHSQINLGNYSSPIRLEIVAK